MNPSCSRRALRSYSTLESLLSQSRSSARTATPPTRFLSTSRPAPATATPAAKPAPARPAAPRTGTYAGRTATPSRPATATPSSTSTTSSAPEPEVVRYSASPKEPLPPTSRNTAASSTPKDLSEGLIDQPPEPDSSAPAIDWSRTYHGLGNSSFSPEASQILLAPLDPDDVEIKPDGILYLPEIKYRRILNRAFGPGSWGLAPRGESIVTPKLVTREYGLIVQGRLISVARGEMHYFDPDGIPTAVEGCKSNALMRCCKDIGIASELWDPRFIRKHMAAYAREVWVEHVTTKKKKKIVIRKDDSVRYPFKETKM